MYLLKLNMAFLSNCFINIHNSVPEKYTNVIDFILQNKRDTIVRI